MGTTVEVTMANTQKVDNHQNASVLREHFELCMPASFVGDRGSLKIISVLFRVKLPNSFDLETTTDLLS